MASYFKFSLQAQCVPCFDWPIGYCLQEVGNSQTDRRVQTYFWEHLFPKPRRTTWQCWEEIDYIRWLDCINNDVRLQPAPIVVCSNMHQNIRTQLTEQWQQWLRREIVLYSSHPGRAFSLLLSRQSCPGYLQRWLMEASVKYTLPL